MLQGREPCLYGLADFRYPLFQQRLFFGKILNDLRSGKLKRFVRFVRLPCGCFFERSFQPVKLHLCCLNCGGRSTLKRLDFRCGPDRVDLPILLQLEANAYASVE